MKFRKLSYPLEGRQSVWRNSEPYVRADESTIATVPVPSWPVAKYTDDNARHALLRNLLQPVEAIGVEFEAVSA